MSNAGNHYFPTLFFKDNLVWSVPINWCGFFEVMQFGEKCEFFATGVSKNLC